MKKTKSVRCVPKKVVEFDYTSLDAAFSSLPKPAQRVLINHRILTPMALSKLTEAEVAALHGMGPSGIVMIRRILRAKKISFR